MKRERGEREGREGYGLLFFILKPSVENSLSHNIFILYYMYITHQFNVQTFLTVSTRGNIILEYQIILFSFFSSFNVIRC